MQNYFIPHLIECLIAYVLKKKKKKKVGGKKRKEIHTHEDVAEKKVQACLLQTLCLRGN